MQIPLGFICINSRTNGMHFNSNRVREFSRLISCFRLINVHLFRLNYSLILDSFMFTLRLPMSYLGRCATNLKLKDISFSDII